MENLESGYSHSKISLSDGNAGRRKTLAYNMDWLILIVFSITLGVTLGILNPPDALANFIVFVAMGIYAYVYTCKSDKRDVFNITKVGYSLLATFTIGLLILGVGGMLLKNGIMIEIFWMLLPILLLTILLRVTIILERRQR